MSQLGQTLTNLQNYNTELNQPTISTIGHTGQYSDVLNPPVISTVGHSGQYTDVLNTPVISNVGHSGQYSDVLNPPVISTVGHSGQYGDVLNPPVISTVGHSGNYGDLNNLPSLAAVATSGQYGDLVNKPALATVATSGSYTDLSNQPSGANVTAVLQGSNIPNASGSVVTTNLGLTQFVNGLAATGTQMQISHNLPPANANQTYIGFAQAYCPASGVDCSILCTIYYVNNTYFLVSCQQQNGSANGESHKGNDILIAWQMSLVNFGYSNYTGSNGYNGIAAGNTAQTVPYASPPTNEA